MAEGSAGPRLSRRLCKDHGLDRLMRFNTTVPQMNAAPTASRAGRSNYKTPDGAPARGFRFRRGLHRTVQRAADAEPARRRRFKAQGGRILHSSQYNDPSIAKGRKVVVLGGSKSATDIAVNAVNSGAGEVTSCIASRCGASPISSAASSTSSASSTSARRRRCSELGHRRAVAARACDRKAARLGELARTGKPAEGAVQARQMQHGAEDTDRGWRQLLGADRDARILPDGRGRPHQGDPRQL